MAGKTYELVADEFNETTSKTGEPFTYVTHKKGDKVTLDAEQARRLIAAGAVKDPAKQGDENAGRTPRAPEGSRPGRG